MTANVRQVRWSMGAGVAFIVLAVAATSAGGNGPDIGSKATPTAAAQKYLQYLTVSGHQDGMVAGGFLFFLAAIAFVWFADGLGARIGAQTMAGRVVSQLGTLGAACLIGGAVGMVGIAGSVAVGGEPLPQGGDVIHLMEDLTFSFAYVGFGLVTAGLIATTAIAGLRTQALPRWACYAGVPAVVGGALAAMFVPIVLPMLWYLAVAVHGLAQRAPATAASRPEPSGSRAVLDQVQPIGP